MAGRHSSKRNQRSGRATARRRRVVGLGGGAGAVLAFGMGPLGGAPTAHADEFDVIIDPIINALSVRSRVWMRSPVSILPQVWI